MEKNSINELYAALSALVTDYEEMEGLVEGRWITVTKDGVTDELTKEDAERWNQTFLTKEDDGARMLANISARTPWCLARYATAQSYLNRGKLLVFLENTPKGTRPAFGVAFDHNGVVYEARGANDQQELSPRFAEVVDSRMKKDKPPGWENYQARLDDARTLAEAERFLNNPKLKPLDSMKPEEQEKYRTYLRAIYELDRKLIGFGYGENTYAKKLREGRDAVRDAGILFGKIATTPAEIAPDTDAYVGSLSADLWEKLGDIEHIYTNFPEGKIIRRDIELKPTSAEEIKDALKRANVTVGDYTSDMLDKIPDRELNEHSSFPSFSLQVKDLFTTDELRRLRTRLPTTKEVFDEKRLKRLGLERCSATVAPTILFEHAVTLAPGQWEYIAMKEIPGRGGNPSVFGVERDGDGSLELDGGWATPEDGWSLGYRVVFRPRK